MRDGMGFALTRAVIRVFRAKRQTCPRKMPVVQNQIQPPADQIVLDRKSFSETWKVFALLVPAKMCNGARKAIGEHVLTMKRVQSVFKPAAKDYEAPVAPIMLLLLKYFAERPESKHANPPRGNVEDQFVGMSREGVSKKLRALTLPKKTPAEIEGFLRDVTSKHVSTHEVEIEYLHWSLESILRALLPTGITIPSSFESIGHIAHLNLRDEHVPYKSLIGEVMLDKLGPRVKTIVNKLQSTGGPYRTFAMEVLAGEENMETSVRESGCIFKLNFADVYWNSRLETEHRRIVASLKQDDILADAFCGIGPFAIPAAKQKRCSKVYANDLNPNSVKYLRENVKLNKVEDSLICTSCSCVRTFLKRIVQEERIPITRVVMNFPSGAPEFLDVFRGLYRSWDEGEPPMPVVHCYCFVKGKEDMDDARRRVLKALLLDESSTSSLSDETIDVRDVRDVAPRKRQVCVTFRLPKSVAFASGETDGGEQPAVKRRKFEAEESTTAAHVADA